MAFISFSYIVMLLCICEMGMNTEMESLQKSIVQNLRVLKTGIEALKTKLFPFEAGKDGFSEVEELSSEIELKTDIEALKTELFHFEAGKDGFSEVEELCSEIELTYKYHYVVLNAVECLMYYKYAEIAEVPVVHPNKPAARLMNNLSYFIQMYNLRFRILHGNIDDITIRKGKLVKKIQLLIDEYLPLSAIKAPTDITEADNIKKRVASVIDTVHRNMVAIEKSIEKNVAINISNIFGPQT